MKNWPVIAILASAQFVMVLDGTVMNVSISTVVEDLDTTVDAMQAAITFYTLTMAAFMLFGAKLGDVWGRRRAFVIGSIVYAVGSLTTALSPNVAVLFVGWSVVEGLGAVLVIPAIAALIADNYEGHARVTAYAIIGAASGAAVAAGPLIGGFMTTYLSWRYVFVGEVVIMAVVVLFARLVTDKAGARPVRIDLLSVVLSALGLVLVVFGMLQSKTWGWVIPLQPPLFNGVEVAPLGISPTLWCMVAGAALIWAFVARQRRLVATGRPPLVDVGLFSILRLRSGLTVLAAQYAMTAGLFFMVPVYLQMTLGLDALQTGIRIFPLSISLILFSIIGTRLSLLWSPRRIIRVGQVVLVLSSLLLLGSVDLELNTVAFGIGMFVAGSALGLLASQIGNVNMSSVGESQSSEVGGLQGVFQNLGASLGTALIGSVLIGALATSFASAVATSELPDATQSVVNEATDGGVSIVPAASVAGLASEAGLDPAEADELASIYASSQVESLRVAFVALIVICLVSLFFSRGIPTEVAGRPREPLAAGDAATTSGGYIMSRDARDAASATGRPELPDPTDFPARWEFGRGMRRRAPRVSHADWAPRSDRPDPVSLLEEQATTRVPELVPIRHARMLVSPFTFYRGAALIMASDLAGTPDSGITTQICGDAHLSNFGGFGTPERQLLFDINDFDETLPGPWEWDVKRLVASFEVAGRHRGFSAPERREIDLAVVRAYRHQMRQAAESRVLDAWYERLDADRFLEFVDEARRTDRIEAKVAKRTEAAIAKARTRDSMRDFAKLVEVVDGRLRIAADPPLIVPIEQLSPAGRTREEHEEWMRQLLRSYRSTLRSARHPIEEFSYLHMARKVVGVGSVGTRAWILLMRGRDDADPLLLQAKQAEASVLERFLPPSEFDNHGERVVVGQRRMQAASDIFLGWQRASSLDGVDRDFYIRQLHDWKIAPDIEVLIPSGAKIYAEICGATLARAHARSGDRVAIAAYLGNSDRFDHALAEFADAYADQNERDYDAFRHAVSTGRIEASTAA